jgi:arabinofuranosyltransferase
VALYISDDERATTAVATRSHAEPAERFRGPAVTAVPRTRPGLSRAVFGLGLTVTAALFAYGAWERRWIADDGLIVLRTVRNLMAGNGPVFNIGERVETNTSAAWTFIVYFFSVITQARLEYVVLALALALSVCAVVFAMLGTARLRGGASKSVLLPAGVLVYIALPPARDFATSGLETCLTIFWLGSVWLLLTRWATTEKATLPGTSGLVFVLGLSWLVRPEMAMVAALMLMVVILAPAPSDRLRPWLQRLLLVAVAGALPVGYQVWRMGYYGLPAPNTAVSKGATGSNWDQGLTYFWNTVGPYWLWLPAAVLLVAALALGWRPRGRAGFAMPRRGRPGLRQRLRSPRSVVTLMLVSGVFLIVYVVKIGGDFMHGRFMLPPLFCLLLPVSVVPLKLNGRVRDWVVPLFAWSALVAWAVVVADSSVQTDKITRIGIVDERAFYVAGSGHPHPILAEDYLDYQGGWMRAMIKTIAQTRNGGLLLPSPYFTYWDVVPPPLPLPPSGPTHTVYFLNLGMTSMNVPLNVRVLDQEGLAYPLAAHSDRLTDGRIGHDKSLPPDWVVADTNEVGRHPWLPFYLNEDWVAEARVALTCPDTRALLDSYRGPITWARWKQNLIHSMTLFDYRFDRVPQYAIEECHLHEPPLQVPHDS